jgi:DNA modification methylase
MEWNNLSLPDNPYFYDDDVVIYNADCRDILPQLPKVDLTITSPPFNLGNNHHTGNIRHHAYDDDIPELEYEAW